MLQQMLLCHAKEEAARATPCATERARAIRAARATLDDDTRCAALMRAYTSRKIRHIMRAYYYDKERAPKRCRARQRAFDARDAREYADAGARPRICAYATLRRH